MSRKRKRLRGLLDVERQLTRRTGPDRTVKVVIVRLT